MRGTTAIPEMLFDTLPTTMQAMRFYAPGDVRYEEVPLPLPGPGEVLVKIGAALTCGSDLKCYRRGHPVLLKNFPSPFGHEFSGTVAAVGEDIERFQPGDRVVAVNSAPCYQCFFCLKGQTNLCENLDLLNGAYAEYITLPAAIAAHNTYAIPDYLSFAAAAFAEPLAIALRGIEDTGVMPGDHVAILGLGAIGQLLVKVAKWKGAHVSVFGRNPMRREFAKRFGGADAVVDITQGLETEQVKARYTPQGRGFDVVIEAVGLGETWQQAFDLVRRGGRVNLFGGCPSGTTLMVDARKLHYDEITLLSLFHHTPRHVQKAVELLSTGVIDPTPLITHRMAMPQAIDALELVSAGGAMKVLLSNPSS